MSEYDDAYEIKYKEISHVLKNLNNPIALRGSPLITSRLVYAIYVESSQTNSLPEALCTFMENLVSLVALGSSQEEAIIQSRFWAGMKLSEVADHFGLAERTVSEIQQKGIYKMAGWFIEKEKAVADKEPQNFKSLCSFERQKEPKPLLRNKISNEMS